MPAFSFKKQFVPFVESGEKTHTIRAKRKNRPRPGQAFYAYYGMRTKQCRKLLQSTITRVQDIRISDHEMVGGDFTALRGLPLVTVDGIELDRSELEQLAKRDGFRDAAHFWNFWSDGDLPFRGDIIHWKRVSNA